MDDLAFRVVSKRRIPHPELYLLVMLGATLAAISTASPLAFLALGVMPLVQLVPRRAPRGRLLRRFVSLAPIAVPAILLRAAWTRGSTPALWAGSVALLRITVATLWTSWLTESLTPGEIDAALLGVGVPVALVDLLSLTRRFGSQLRQSLSAAWTGAALRGGFSSVSALSTTAGGLAGVLVVRALERSDRVAISLALRGHGGTFESDPEERVDERS
jgi:energy-coupling factor transporter transmembrane protein EcfT